MNLKRLWDVTNKKMVFVKGPTGHECQLWVDEATEKMYYYDMSQWIEYTQSAGNDGRTYGPTWKVVDSDDEMGVYDTNEATELFNWESGDEASYVFKDWDGTVLKEGKVKEGTKPTAPADPTREATAQYTYTFAGWNPTVAKITKKTTYTATYTATVNKYTITWKDGDDNTIETDTNVEYGATPTYNGETPTKTATAQYTYTWDGGWTPTVATVTGNATYTATFTAESNAFDLTIVAPEATEASAEIEVDNVSESFPYNMEFTGSVTVRQFASQELYITSGGVTKHVVPTPGAADSESPSEGRWLGDWQFNDGGNWERIVTEGTPGEDAELGNYYEMTFDGDVSLRASYDYYEPEPEPEPDPAE